MIANCHVCTPSIKNNDTIYEKYTRQKREEFLEPDDVAQAYYDIHCQKETAWTQEIDLRPFCEKF